SDLPQVSLHLHPIAPNISAMEQRCKSAIHDAYDKYRRNRGKTSANGSMATLCAYRCHGSKTYSVPEPFFKSAGQLTITSNGCAPVSAGTRTRNRFPSGAMAKGEEPVVLPSSARSNKALGEDGCTESAPSF